MFVRTVKSVLAIASLTTLVTTTGCLTDLVAPESTNERVPAADSLRQEVAEKISPVDYTVEPLTPRTWEAYARLMERHNGVFGGCEIAETADHHLVVVNSRTHVSLPSCPAMSP